MEGLVIKMEGLVIKMEGLVIKMEGLVIKMEGLVIPSGARDLLTRSSTSASQDPSLRSG
jgi:hypothetical protein